MPWIGEKKGKNVFFFPATLQHSKATCVCVCVCVCVCTCVSEQLYSPASITSGIR